MSIKFSSGLLVMVRTNGLQLRGRIVGRANDRIAVDIDAADIPRLRDKGYYFPVVIVDANEVKLRGA